MDGKIKLWAGVGACLLVTTPATQAAPHGAALQASEPAVLAAAPHAAQHGAAAAPKAEGGEGGEGGESGQGPVKGPADYTSRLLLMKGHLRVGRELYAQGDKGNGLAHFLHPRSELYGGVAPALQERGAAGFEQELAALAEAASRKADWQAVQPAYDRVLERIDAAIGRVDAAERAAPGFTVEVVMALLRQSAREYGEAVKGGKFVNVAEYQDGRGFVLTAGELLREQARALGGRNKDAYARLMQQYQALEKAWPTVTPPRQPALTPSQVQAAVSRIELEASQLR